MLALPQFRPAAPPLPLAASPTDARAAAAVAVAAASSVAAAAALGWHGADVETCRLLQPGVTEGGEPDGVAARARVRSAAVYFGSSRRPLAGVAPYDAAVCLLKCLRFRARLVTSAAALCVLLLLAFVPCARRWSWAVVASVSPKYVGPLSPLPAALGGGMQDKSSVTPGDKFIGKIMAKAVAEEPPNTTTTEDPEVRKAEIASCFFDSFESTLFLMQAALSLNNAVEGCDPENNERLPTCMSTISGVISGFSWLAEYISAARANCPVGDYVQSQCSAAIEQIIAAVSDLTAVGVTIDAECTPVASALADAVGDHFPFIGLSGATTQGPSSGGGSSADLNSSANSSGASSLDGNASNSIDSSSDQNVTGFSGAATQGSSVGSSPDVNGSGNSSNVSSMDGNANDSTHSSSDPNATGLLSNSSVTRRLQPSPARQVEIAFCVVNVGVGISDLARSGLAIQQSIDDCDETPDKAGCAADVGAIINGIVDSASVLSSAATNCAETANRDAACASGIAGILSVLSNIEAAGSAVKLACIDGLAQRNDVLR